MSDVAPTHAANDQNGPATDIGRFLARRGVLLVKETRPAGVLDCQFTQISVATLTMHAFSTPGSNRSEASYGVLLEQSDHEGEVHGRAYLDFDELAELASALSFVEKLALKMPNPPENYTEVIYATKDNVQFGFYSGSQGPEAFIKFSDDARPSFLPLAGLKTARYLIEDSSEHLAGRGATAK